jgi:hypothetical protein
MSRLSDEIKQTFDLEKLRLEAAQKLTKEEWPDFMKMRQGYEGQRRFAKRAFELEYDERVAMARVRLINKAGQKNLTLKPRWAGGDRFDKDAINRQAHREVRHAHRNDLARIERDEIRDTQQQIESSKVQRAFREMPKHDFNRAADRRSGAERRTRSRD